MEIVIDTREQKPLPFRVVGSVDSVVTRKLSTGDYSITGYEDKIVFERKSPADLYQTLCRGNKRFQRELARATQMDYFGMIIEAPFTAIRDKTFPNSHMSKVRSDVVCKILWSLMFKYDIHVHFCNNPSESSSLVRQVFDSYLRWKDKKPKVKLAAGTMEMAKAIQKLKRRCGFK
jgi:ERCC4-type nuclease